jgi:tetratricopeptide (TPR) repeat protein
MVTRTQHQDVEQMIGAGRLFEAKKRVAELLALDPKCAESYRLLGEIYLAQDSFETARAALRRAQRLAPGDERVDTLLAQVDHVELAQGSVSTSRTAVAEHAKLARVALARKKIVVEERVRNPRPDEDSLRITTSPRLALGSSPPLAAPAHVPAPAPRSRWAMVVGLLALGAAVAAIVLVVL